MSFNHGSLWWTELMTRDVAGAMDWYRDICGWTFESARRGGRIYHVAIAHGEPVAGITDMSAMPHFDAKTPHWFTYFAVDDVEATIAQVTDGGGSVVRSPLDVPGVGRIAIVQDPTGAALGLMTPHFLSDDLVEADLAEEDAEEDMEENFPV